MRMGTLPEEDIPKGCRAGPQWEGVRLCQVTRAAVTVSSIGCRTGGEQAKAGAGGAARRNGGEIRTLAG